MAIFFIKFANFGQSLSLESDNKTTIYNAMNNTGIVVDYPNSAKAKKHYLVLSCDRTSRKQLPQGMTGDEKNHVQVSSSQSRRQELRHGKAKPIRKKKGVKTKEWILHKKETQRKKGKNVRPDTKYTARRRRGKF